MQKKLRVLFAAILILACFSAASVYFSGTGGIGNPKTAESFGEEPQLGSTISALELKTLIASRAPILILDVRQPEEFQDGHIENAVLIPLDTLPKRLIEVPKDMPVVVYCRSGKRSAQAVSLLLSKGFIYVVGLAGGYQEWQKAQ